MKNIDPKTQTELEAAAFRRLDEAAPRGHARPHQEASQSGAESMLDTNPIATESVAADQLKSFIERIERLEEEKAGLAGDLREVYAEAKGNGFDTKAMRRIV